MAGAGMAQAIDGADVVLFAVSQLYKESANCRECKRASSWYGVGDNCRTIASDKTVGCICLRSCAGLECNYSHQQQKPMIPLMMENGFSPTGWLGLLLGSSMWYGFYDMEDVDDATFELKVDAVVAAIGDRGRLPEGIEADISISLASEAIPPARRTTPARSPAPAPTPIQAPSDAPGPTLMDSVHQMPPSTPQMSSSRSEKTAALFSRSAAGPAALSRQNTMSPSISVGESGSSRMVVSFETMAAFLDTQQDRMQQQHADAQSQMAAQHAKIQAQLEHQLQVVLATQRDMEQRHMDAQSQMAEQHAKTQTQLEQQLQAALATQRAMQQQIDALREEARRAAEKGPLAHVVSDEQLAALQSRLTTLHEASQLTDDELFIVEDIIADCVEVMTARSFVGNAAIVGEVAKIVALNERIKGDLSFARQLRRKAAV